mmetsp:Transcript_81664/g.236736  ORF Transcript_81664/g.236736 Transcript_81664/m.236736 type:complete len:522 (+) Transcript_81664:111-1676(+)
MTLAGKPVLDDDAWLTQQLKLTREQLDKKSNFCDQLAGELRRLEAELEAKNSAARESRDLLRSTTSELKAAAQAAEAARAAQEEDAAALRLEVEKLRTAAKSFGKAEVDCTGEALPFGEGAPVEDDKLRHSQKEVVEDAIQERSDPSRSVSKEVDELRRELQRERDMHQETLRQLHVQQQRGDEEVEELQQELARVGSDLEQKEEEMLSIQFDMVSLQNRLRDQSQLVASNADAFQQASEELADKDEELHEAMERQDELVQQINQVSTQLQDKVTKLSEELESSRSAYQALEEQTRVKVSHLQTDRDALKAELERVRARCVGDGFGAAEELQERLLCAEVEISDLRSALERSRLCERQALERAQEYRTSLELYREFGAELFGSGQRHSKVSSPMVSQPGESPTSPPPDAEENDEEDQRRFPSDTMASAAAAGDAAGEVALRSVLIAIELNLGCVGTATLTVAPWQTRSDFDGIVADFLQENKIKSIFAEALIRYLEEVEETAESFPTHVRANLSEIHSLYG